MSEPDKKTTDGAKQNDLIAENWQAPRQEDLKGSGREAWEYSNDTEGPSLRLRFTMALVFLVLASILTLIGWFIFDLFTRPI